MRHPGWINNRRDYQRFDEILGFVVGEQQRDRAILAVKDGKGAVLHTSPTWPEEIDPMKLDCDLADDPEASSAGNTASVGRGWGGPGGGMGPGGGQAAFTKIPEFRTVTTAAGEWRLGMMGSDDTTLIVGLNTGQVRAELNHLRNGFLLALPFALLNLLVNAVKYNEPGGRVLATLDSRENQAFFSIANSGPGIPEADKDRIFTHFHRVDAARQRKVDGIGLGLSLAREILRAHDGELELRESRPGWTSFLLRMKEEQERL